MKVLFYCGLGACEANGTMLTTEEDWHAGMVETICPTCGQLLRQSEHHFEDLNAQLQRERVTIASKHGPLTDSERLRLREIHTALGHPTSGEFNPEKDSLVMKIASHVMARIRGEETKN